MDWPEQPASFKPISTTSLTGPSLDLGRGENDLWKNVEQVYAADGSVKKTKRLKFVRVHRGVEEEV